MEAQSLVSHQHSWWFSCFSLREKLARSHNDLTIYYNPEGKNYFKVGTIVLNFIQIEVDKWLLTTVNEVIEELPATSKKLIMA
ncbi:hypothetical protein HPA12_09660 [Streptococcus suis]|nr:hypothetical protein [Streptococcus suis]